MRYRRSWSTCSEPFAGGIEGVGVPRRSPSPLRADQAPPAPTGRPVGSIISTGLSRGLALLRLIALLTLLAACAPTSGILAGGSWQSTGLHEEHIRALAVSVTDPNVIYAGDMQRGIFVSLDAGEHWQQRTEGLPLPLAVNALGIAADERHLYAATDRGIFVSLDSGLHWLPANKGLPADSYTALAFDLTHPAVLYAGTAHHGIFLSRDGGTSWSALSDQLPAMGAINALAYVTDQRQLWAAATGGIYRSADGGKSWQTLNAGLPAGSPVYALEPAALVGGSPDLVYAGTAQGFFLSRDGGAHWQRSQETLARVSVRAVLVDFRTPTTLYLGTSIGVFRSTDGGEIWSAVQGLPKDQTVYALALGTQDYLQLFAAVNDVYEFPGSSGGWNLSGLLALPGVAAFFALLYWIAGRGRRRRGGRPQPTADGQAAAPAAKSGDGATGPRAVNGRAASADQ
jgi:photosystem II stability/assembly factor-like uncharacterized protein